MDKRRRAQIGRMMVHNPASPIGKPIGSERARELSAMVKNHPGKGGRPRQKDRCPCGKFTKPRAAQRNHKCVAPEVKTILATLRQELRELVEKICFDGQEVAE